MYVSLERCKGFISSKQAGVFGSGTLVEIAFRRVLLGILVLAGWQGSFMCI